MTQRDAEIWDLKILNVARDGKRRYDPHTKQKLIEACLQPGVSLAGLALKHGVNANLLRKWVARYEQELATPEVASASAFVSVVAHGNAVEQTVNAEPMPVIVKRGADLPLPRLTAHLPNGVTLHLDCNGGDATLMSALIDTLGRCNVSPGR